MSSKKQTAVEWLINQLMDSGYGIPKEWREKAKEMHKQEVIDAYENGEAEWTPFEFKTAKDYYNQTFGS